MSPLAELYSTSTMEHHHFDQCIMIISTKVRHFSVLCCCMACAQVIIHVYFSIKQLCSSSAFFWLDIRQYIITSSSCVKLCVAKWVCLVCVKEREGGGVIGIMVAWQDFCTPLPAPLFAKFSKVMTVVTALTETKIKDERVPPMLMLIYSNLQGSDILCNVAQAEYEQVIQMLENAILSTDLALYFRLALFTSFFQSPSIETWCPPPTPTPRQTV